MAHILRIEATGTHSTVYVVQLLERKKSLGVDSYHQHKGQCHQIQQEQSVPNLYLPLNSYISLAMSPAPL